MSVRLVVSNHERGGLEAVRDEPAADPRDPALYRQGLSSARAALRDGRARRFGVDPPSGSPSAASPSAASPSDGAPSGGFRGPGEPADA